MILHHFTNGQNAEPILRTGQIVSRMEKIAMGLGGQGAPIVTAADQAIDSVVWLTSHRPARQAWQAGDWKHQFRFDVQVEEPEPWAVYGDRVGLDPDYRRMLEYPGTLPDSWFVVPGPIGAVDWVRVKLTDGDRAMWNRGGDLDTAADLVGRIWAQTVRQVLAAQQGA